MLRKSIYCVVFKRLATPSDVHIPLPSIVPFVHSYISFTRSCIYPIFPFLDLFHSWLYISHLSIPRSLSLLAVYIPSFQVLRGRPRFSLPSGLQLNVIFGNRVGSILSTWTYQMSCFQVISSNIVSCSFIFPLIYSFVFLSSLEILAYRRNASIPVTLITLLSSPYKLQVSAPW